MKLMSSLCVAFLLIFSVAFAQTIPFEKECRLAGGGGFANGFGNASGGPDIWLQMSYRLSKNFSVGTEFENMYYKRPTYNFSLLNNKDYNQRKFYDNYASFIIKYHLPIPSKINVAVASGWTYMISNVDYFEYQNTIGGSSYITSRNYTFNDYSIPFIAEINYPISKIFQAGIRAKYNLNDESVGATYSTGLAVSIKL